MSVDFISKQANSLDIKNEEEREEDEELIIKEALHIARAIAFPAVLKSIIELNILQIISEASDRAVYLSASEVAIKIPGCVNPNASATLDRMLSFLTSFGILECKVQSNDKNGEGKDGEAKRVYGVAPICKYLLTTEGSPHGTVGPWFLCNHDKSSLESWNHLSDALLEGETPFIRAHGMPPYEYFKKEPRIGKMFNQTMSDLTTIVIKRMLAVYQGFQGIKVLVDVGGGVGQTLSLVISKYPNIKGINFDLPEVVAEATTTNPRVTHVGGDMFESVPKGDAIFMKWILLNWDDEHCLKILKNCCLALPEKGKAIVVESLSPTSPEYNRDSQIAYQDDITMMTYLGGKGRSREKLEAMALQAGFSSCKVVCMALWNSVIELHKA